MLAATHEGFKINYFISRKKNKPFIVFIHGLAGNYTEFYHQINALKDDYSILALDLLGHGQSDKPKGSKYYKPEYGVGLILDIFKREKIANPVIIGFSLGGFLACKISEKVSVKKLVLINPAFGVKSARLFFLFSEFFSRFVPRFFLKFFVKSYKAYEYHGLLDEYAKMLLQTPCHVHKAIVESIKAETFLNISQKAYVIKSNHDEILNNYLPTKDYEIFRINGFHLVHVQHHMQVTKIILKILSDNKQ